MTNFETCWSVLVLCILIHMAAGTGTALDPPTNITVGNATFDSFHLKFTRNANAENYEVVVTARLLSTDVRLIITNKTSVKVTGLSNNVRYDVKMRSRSSDGIMSNFSDVQHVRTNPDGAAVVVSDPLPTIFTVFVEPVSGARAWSLCVSNMRTGVVTIESLTYPYKTFRNMDPDTYYKIKARVENIMNTNFSEEESSFGQEVTIKTAQLTMFGRVTILNETLDDGLKSKSSPRYNVFTTKWEEFLRMKYNDKDENVTSVKVLELEKAVSPSGVTCHHEIFYSGPIPSNASALVLENDESLFGSVVTEDVSPDSQYIVFINGGMEEVSLDHTGSCEVEDSIDVRVFVFHRGDEASLPEEVNIDPSSESTMITRMTHFKLNGTAIFNPEPAGKLHHDLRLNTLYSIDQSYLLKYCQASNSNSFLYSRRYGAYSEYTSPKFKDTFIHSTDPAEVDVSKVTYTVSSDLSDITVRMPPVYRANSYEFEIKDIAYKNLSDLDSSSSVEATLTGFVMSREYCVDISVTINHPDWRKATSHPSCFEFYSGSPKSTTIRIIEATTTRFTISYALIKFATIYVLEISNDTYARNHTSTKDLFVMDDVTPGDVYQVRVATQNPFGTGIFSATKQTKFWWFSEITNSSLKLTWENETSDARYEISVYPTASVYTSDISEVFINSLLPGIVYDYTVVAISADERQTTLFTDKQITAPPMPENVTQTEKGSNVISVKADPVISAWQYHFEIFNWSGYLVASNNSTMPTASFYDLEAGSFYYVEIYAENDAGNSEKAGIAAQTLPENVMNFKLIPSSHKISLSWNPSKGADRYNITLLKNGTVIDGTVVVYVTKMAISALDAGTKYNITISAGGLTGYSAERFESATTDKDIPSEITSEDVTNSSFKVTWQPIKGTISYIITLRGYDNASTSEITVSIANITFSNLMSGTIYVVTVTAIYPEGKSQASPPLQQITIPGDPSQVEVTYRSTNMLGIKWLPVTGADWYTVRVIEDESIVLEENVTTGFTNLTQLVGGAKYLIEVVAENEAGPSGPGILIARTDFVEVKIRLTYIGQYVISIAFDKPKKADKFIIRVVDITNSLQLNGFYDVQVTPPLSIFPLNPGSNYSISIISVYDNVWSNASCVTHITAPANPVPVIFETPFSVNVTYREIFGADEYIIMLDSQVVIVTELYHVFDNLEAGTRYTVAVAARNNAGRSYFGNKTIHTDSPIPDNVLTASVTGDSFYVSWDGIQGALEYTVFVGNTFTGHVSNISTNTSFASIRDLEPGTNYSVRVTATYRVGDTGASNPVYQITVPVAPTYLRIVSRATYFIAIQWNDSVGSEYYLVSVSGKNSSKKIETSWMNVTGLMAGSKYEVELQAANTAGISTASIYEVETLPDGPQFSLGNATSSSILVAWNATTGAKEYEVTLTTEDGKTVEGVIGTGITVSTSVVISGLSVDTVYTVEVVTISDDLRSEVNIALKFVTVPGTPTGLHFRSRTSTSLSVGWNKSEGISRYETELDGTTAITSDNTATFNGLSAGTEYLVKLTAISAVELKSDSTTGKFQTLPLSPAFHIKNITQTTFDICWNSQKGAGKYNVRIFGLTDAQDIETTLTKVTVRNLTSGTWYNVTVTSIVAVDESDDPQVTLITTLCSPPGGVHVTSVTQNSVTVVWDAERGATRYELSAEIQDSVLRKRRSSEAQPEVTIYSSWGRIGNLLPSSSYEISLSAINSAGSSEKVSELVKTGANNPPSFSVENVTISSITLRWEAQTGADEYRVIIREEAEVYPRFEIALNAEHYIGNLRPGFSYFISLTTLSTTEPGAVVYENLESSPTETIITVPLPPENLIVLAKNDGQGVLVSWTSVKGAVVYILDVTTADLNLSFNTTENSMDVSQITEKNVDYYFTMAAVNAQDRKSKRSETVVFKKTQTATAESRKNVILWVFIVIAFLAITVILLLILWKVKKSKEESLLDEDTTGFYDLELARRYQDVNAGTDNGEIAGDAVELEAHAASTSELQGHIGPQPEVDDDEQQIDEQALTDKDAANGDPSDTSNGDISREENDKEDQKDHKK